jgi:tetratricopeptide (TPR) repeat protein
VILPVTKSIYRIVAVMMIMAAALSCSVEKNTNLSRFYHNLTSRYNIYFNGYQSYLNGLERVSAANSDNFSLVFPVFEYSNRDAAVAATGDMERTIQKCSKLISLHSITARPEIKSNEPLTGSQKEFYERSEYNDWVDDSYLLMGKAQMIQGKYSEARITLLHNSRESNDPVIVKASRIWLARISTETGEYSEAARLLEEITLSGLPEEIISEYYLSVADLALRQGDYSGAIEPLAAGVEELSSKHEKLRLTFLLARVAEESGNRSLAEKHYREVLKMNPPYELEFNARINQAGVFDVESGDAGDIRKNLNKLMRDEKNRDYLDQIYYALGNLSLRERDTLSALDHFRKSASLSTGNTTQKARSYLVLADYWYKTGNYLKAQAYYDSTVTFLPADYPGYSDISTLSGTLNELAGNLNTITREDSLQYVASLPEPQRDALITRIINEITLREREAEAVVDQRYNMGEFYENQRRFRGDIEASGKWYFYNQSALTFGRSEFRNRWGERPLEDNWRRINRSRTGTFGTGNGAEQTDSAGITGSSGGIKSADYYLRDLPLTDSLVEISNGRIAMALFNAGRILAERIDESSMAAEYYNQLVTRYPDHQLVPQALYNLVMLYRNESPALAESYSRRLVSSYPETEFAKIISDPDYYSKRIEEERRSAQLYNQAFEEYKKGNYTAALSLCETGTERYPGSELIPKFNLLRAFAMATIVDERELKGMLSAIVQQFPGTPEAERASDLIEYLNTEIPELKIEEEQQIARELFSRDITGPHYFVAVIMNNNEDINRLTFDVINFNIDNYTSNNYSANGELFSNRFVMITVGTFPGREEATNYMDSFDPARIFGDHTSARVITFIITPDNMNILKKENDPEKYNLFYLENYLPAN